MKTFEIKGEIRKATGKLDSQKLRNAEKVPCVLYGGKENLHFSLELKPLKKLVYSPHVYLVDLDLNGKKHSAIIKELQFHAVTDVLTHVDFLEIFEDKPIEMHIPVEVHGLSAGVKAGGKLSIITRKLKVKALPKNMPDTLKVDVTDLGMGKSVKVGDLKYDNIELLNVKNTVIASVKLTRAAKGTAPGETPEATPAA
ncbi:MAG: 50S ribosomal protein L25/general stress protein Ctc [Bacteroidales bacterium]